MFQELLKYYLDYFNQHGEASIKTICNCTVPSKIILEEYKKLPPLEMLGDEEKKELKEYVIELFPEKSIEEKELAAKIVYTIGSLI